MNPVILEYFAEERWKLWHWCREAYRYVAVSSMAREKQILRSRIYFPINCFLYQRYTFALIRCLLCYMDYEDDLGAIVLWERLRSRTSQISKAWKHHFW